MSHADATDTPPAGKGPAKATFVQLTFLIYGAACGGAFGAEQIVSESGPGMAVATLFLVPAVFCIPVAMAVAELTATFPVEGGNYRWSRMAWGDLWGFQAAWWTWMTGVVTNVMFAVLFANYLQQWFPAIEGPAHTLACVALIWGMHYLNIKGIEIVGNAAILFTVVLLVPFVVMTVLAVGQWGHHPLVPFTRPGLSLLDAVGVSLGLAIFLYSGYDKLSVVSEEVENPQAAFPPALVLAVMMAVASYTVPTIAALGALGNWRDWGEGYFSRAAELIGGKWLYHAMTLAGLISNALLLNVTMLAVSRMPMALADDGFLPGILKRRHPIYQTPTQSLLWGSITYSLMTLVEFKKLVIINVWFQMMSNILIFANVWSLRRAMPDVPRPFVIPMGQVGLVACTVATWGLAIFAIGTTIVKGGGVDWEGTRVGTVALLSGILIHVVISLLRRRQWRDVDPRAAPRP